MAKNGKHAVKRPLPQFETETPIKWQNEGSKQPVTTSTFCRLDPVTKISSNPTNPVQLDFLFHDSECVWSFGENTYFNIELQFQNRVVKEDGTFEEWTPCDAAEAGNVIVEPHFLGTIIKDIEVYVNHNKVNVSDENGHVGGYLDRLRYFLMDKEQKRKLCYHAGHTGNGVPTTKNGWTLGDTTEWNKYAKTIFLGPDKNLVFNYVPLDIFPFFQGSNYLEFAPKCLPLPILNQINVRILFHDHMDYIFKIKAGVKKEYRIYFKDFSFCYEKLKLSDSFRRAYLEKKTFDYPGVTRLMRQENVVAGNTTFLSTIQNCPFPQGAVMYFVPKEVLAGTYKYSDNTTGDVFLPHNIKNIEFTYGKKPFFTDTPKIGDITRSQIEFKSVTDYFNQPPFGMTCNKDLITLSNVADGWKGTCFPHIYLNFCTTQNNDRYLPIYDKGTILSKNSLKNYENLEFTFIFNPGGAPTGATLIIYLFFTDNMVSLDNSRRGSPFFNSEYITMSPFQK